MAVDPQNGEAAGFVEVRRYDDNELSDANVYEDYQQNLEREVDNGGFSQYFTNSSGGFAHETILSLKAVGADKTAEILQQAIDQFPGKQVPKDRAERIEVVEQIEEKAGGVWEQLDQKL